MNKVIEYTKTYKQLTKALKEKNKLAFFGLEGFFETEELKKGFGIKKKYKTTKNGTKILFKAIDEKEIRNRLKEMEKEIEEMKTCY